MEKNTQISNWPDLAIGLYDRLTDRKAEIIYEVENLEVDVPSNVGGDAGHAKWKINGILKIRTRDDAH